jgi:hypothetical protein
MSGWRERAVGVYRRTKATVRNREAGTGRTTRSPAPTARPVDGVRIEYTPSLDGDPDPGEVVWTWVPYEEDPNQGKDRPVLVVGRSGASLVGLMLSSQSERDGQRNWFPLGPGAWDRDGRPSWVRLDRVITVDADGIRREGAIMEKGRFDQVAVQLRTGYGWD